MGDYDLAGDRRGRQDDLDRPVVQGRRIQTADDARDGDRAEGRRGAARQRCRSTCSSAICRAAARRTCRSRCASAISRRSATPDGYDGYTFGGKRGDGRDASRSTATATRTRSPLPPTQTLPATLGGDGTARDRRSTCRRSTAPTDMLVEMDYQDANGEMLTASQAHPDLPLGGAARDQDRRLADEAGRSAAAASSRSTPTASRSRARTSQVALYSRQILTARRRLIGGFYAYDNQMKTDANLGATCTATTDAQGLAQVQRSIPACRAKSMPSRPPPTPTATSARAVQLGLARGRRRLVVRRRQWRPHGRRPRKAAYKAGETARFQVRMPFREATALVTVEREGVLSSFVTKLSGTDPVVEVTMPGSYAPDVYRLGDGGARARASRAVELAARHRAARSALASAPTEAQEPTALVDLAKPSYRLGIAKVKVGWEGAPARTSRSRPTRQRYAARDTAQVDVAGQDARRQAGAHRRRRLRRGRRGAAPARAQRQLGRADRDDGRAAAVGAHLDRADAGRRQAPLRPQGGRGGRRRRRRPVGAQPREFPAGAAVAGPVSRSTRNGHAAVARAAERRAVVASSSSRSRPTARNCSAPAAPTSAPRRI